MTIATRIKTAREYSGFDQAELGKRVGVSQQAVQKWEKNGVSNTTRLVKIARVCGVSFEWLSTGEGVPVQSESGTPSGNVTSVTRKDGGPDAHRSVPLISWVKAGEWSEVIDNFSTGDAEEVLPCPVNHSDCTFALRVDGDSMTSPYPGSRSYPDGTIIFVDPEREPSVGDRVVAKLDDDNAATFKVLSEDAGELFLKPLNPQYKNLYINGNCHIIGKVIGSFIPE